MYPFKNVVISISLMARRQPPPIVLEPFDRQGNEASSPPIDDPRPIDCLDLYTYTFQCGLLGCSCIVLQTARQWRLEWNHGTRDACLGAYRQSVMFNRNSQCDLTLLLI
jgi:hypothetical protein